jgi:hypothetical protein
MFKDELVLQSEGGEVFRREVGFALVAVALVVAFLTAMVVLFALAGSAAKTQVQGFFRYVQSLRVVVLDDLFSGSFLLSLVFLRLEHDQLLLLNPVRVDLSLFDWSFGGSIVGQIDSLAFVVLIEGLFGRGDGFDFRCG